MTGSGPPTPAGGAVPPKKLRRLSSPSDSPTSVERPLILPGLVLPGAASAADAATPPPPAPSLLSQKRGWRAALEALVAQSPFSSPAVAAGSASTGTSAMTSPAPTRIAPPFRTASPPVTPSIPMHAAPPPVVDVSFVRANEQFFRHGRQSRIVMALKSGLPNEIDWAVHTVYLRSAVSGYDFLISDYPHVVEALLDLVAPFLELAPESLVLDAAKALVHYNALRERMSPLERLVDVEREAMPAVPGLMLSPKWEFAYGRLPPRLVTWVTKVADIFNNLSFSASNTPVMATSKPIIYFQLHCLQLDETVSAHVDLRIGALTVLVHVAPHLRIDTYPTLLRVLATLAQSDDRTTVLTALRILKLLTNTLENDHALASLDLAALARIVNLLLLDDDVLVHAALEFLNRYSSIGPETCTRLVTAVGPGVVTLLFAVMSTNYRGWLLPHVPKKKEEVPATATAGDASAGGAAAADNGSSAPPTPTAAAAAALAPGSPRELPSPVPKKPEEPRPVHDRYRTCIGWIKAFYQVVPGSRLSVSDVYHGYREDAQALGDQPVALLNFLQYLKEALPGVHTTLDLAAANGVDAAASGGVGGTQYIQNIGVRPARPMRSSIPVQSGATDKLSRPSTPPVGPVEAPIASADAPAEVPSEPPTEATANAAGAAASVTASTTAGATDGETTTEVTMEATAPEAKVAADTAAATVDSAADAPPPAADAAAESSDAAKDTAAEAPQVAAEPAPMDVDANASTHPATGASEQAAVSEPTAVPEPSAAPEPEAALEPNPAPEVNLAPDALTAALMDVAEPEPAQPTEVWPCRWRGCDVGLELTSREALLEHIANAHCPAAPDHACQWATCTRTLPMATALLAHVQVHLPKHGVPAAALPPVASTRTDGVGEAPLTATQLAGIAAPAAPAAAKAGGEAGASRLPLPRMPKSTEPAGPAFLAALILQNMAAVATLRPLFVAQQSRLFEWASTASRLASYSAAILAELETRPGSFTG